MYVQYGCVMCHPYIESLPALWIRYCINATILQFLTGWRLWSTLEE